MNKGLTTILTSMILIFSLCIYAQKANVQENANDSYNFAKKGNNSANDALTDIKNAYSETSVEDIQDFASKAKSNIDDAMNYSKKAKNEAGECGSEANNINCSNAEDEASYAEIYFKKAYNEFDDAYTSLKNASSEDDKIELVDYLDKAVISINDGMSYLKKAVNYLNSTLIELKECK